jgi:phosphatidylethanolamine/phosphatidyl-N-methylethanolamine N-methyltransferase
VLPPGGRFLQYTYGLTSPVQPVLRQRLGLVGHPVTRVLLNIPPAVVWSYSATESKSFGRLKQAA